MPPNVDFNINATESFNGNFQIEYTSGTIEDFGDVTLQIRLVCALIESQGAITFL